MQMLSRARFIPFHGNGEFSPYAFVVFCTSCPSGLVLGARPRVSSEGCTDYSPPHLLDFGAGEIVADDGLEGFAAFGEDFCASLTHADSVSPAAPTKGDVSVPCFDIKETALDDVRSHYHPETVDLDDPVAVFALDFQGGDSPAGGAPAVDGDGACSWDAGRAELFPKLPEAHADLPTEVRALAAKRTSNGGRESAFRLPDVRSVLGEATTGRAEKGQKKFASIKDDDLSGGVNGIVGSRIPLVRVINLAAG